ncbi:hypothetical protein I4U23_007516 [Adineta vaga]|nr:hypothetical protein I4U23_007516 [Adineta vaga]
MHDLMQGANKLKDSDGAAVVRNNFTLTPSLSTQSLSSSRTETTIFDQVYGDYRRRPAMISLNVQWIPVNDRIGTYQWNENDNNSINSSNNYSRKVKTVTFFGTGEMRGQQQPKAVTPPSSDYTDAYLSTFASKSIPKRHIHRLSTSIFANSAPIPLKPTNIPIFTSSSMKPSQTYFDTIHNNQRSTTFTKPTLPSSSGSFTYSESYIPEKTTSYEPFSSKQYFSPESQTFTSNYSTSLRSPTSTSTFSSFNRLETAYESIYKPMAPYSVQSYPPSNIDTTLFDSTLSTQSSYTSYKPFESTPLLTSSNINQFNTIERTISPTPNVEKPLSRPETLLFQPDEDIRTSLVTKPSPFVNPSPETPATDVISQIEKESASTGNLVDAASAPIRILENTLNKYDSLINQISEVLASVSPLSSTISSMSPGKSVLDYQLSSDDSPTLPNQRIENQLSQQSQAKSNHLIREDSYDKIVTAISDLDTEILSPSDTQNKPVSIDEDIKRSPLAKHQTLPGVEEEKNEVSQTISTTKESEEESETEVSSTPQHTLTTTEKKDENVTDISTDEQVEETKAPIIDQSKTESLFTQEKKEEETTTSTFADDQQTTIKNQEESTADKKEDEQQILSLTSTHQEESKDLQMEPIEEQDEATTVVSTNEQQVSSASKDEQVEEKKEETATTTFADDQQTTVKNQEESTADKKEDEQQVLSTASTHQEESKDSQTATSEEQNEATTIVSTDEQQVSPASKDETAEETKMSVVDQLETESTSMEIKSEDIEDTSTSSPEQQQEQTSSAVIITNESTSEEKTAIDEFIQQQTGLLSSVPNDTGVMDEIEESFTDDDGSSKKSAKHVTCMG